MGLGEARVCPGGGGRGSSTAASGKVGTARQGACMGCVQRDLGGGRRQAKEQAKELISVTIVTEEAFQAKNHLSEARWRG